MGPLAGSLVYRSVQFGAYSYVHALCGAHSVLRNTLPATKIEQRVVVGGLASGLARAAVETPLEFYKVRRQTGGAVRLTDAYRGFSVTLARSCGLMTTFFVLLDVASRHVPPDVASGAFFRGGVCATIGWWSVWPLEVAKSQIQSGLPGYIYYIYCLV